ncbi:GNAT family N-acetyltransferase [Acinetobacter bereziniae]|nr:GNAT family N-acetyltransferase [Acinetobacter bereziniae]NUG07451.1 GNAT family N-acetyltransferase [Acinetobacter bereziniae]NUG64809.1 GNAT family N-acetyltransferase [Acinetobacter bereziniae]NUG69372.1 GNAT family N-acetyltransferase [Acinetobacter bereziniae]NUG81481.1 GNAT family N-acetyltransferase [Acinetobacter bereziniae]
MKISFRLLQYAEIDLIWQQIDRKELITHMYLQHSQQLQRIDCFYDVQCWDQYHLENDPPLIKHLCQQGAICIGGFTPSNQLIAVQVVSNQKITDYPQAKLLQYFYVDAHHQSHGIGSQLMQTAITSAKKLGAKQLYISATPTQRTVDFYLKQGAKLLEKPDHQLWSLEPEDIHLIYNLS